MAKRFLYQRATPLILLLLGGIPLAASIVRLNWFADGADPSSNPAQLNHFVELPIPIILHVVSGSIFVLLACAQLTAHWRVAAPRLHRWLGYIAAPAGLLAAITAMQMSVLYPVHSLSPVAMHVVRFIFSAYMAIGLILAVLHIRAGRHALHRAWMIRAFAMGVAGSTQALLIIAAHLFLGRAPDGMQITGLLFAGFVVNATFAEVWLRRKPRALRRPIHST